jgi:hypothetical protein
VFSFSYVGRSETLFITKAEEISRFARNKKGSPIGKPFNIVYVITQNVTGLPKGKYDGDGCVLFVSLRSKNKRDTLKSKINFQLLA